MDEIRNETAEETLEALKAENEQLKIDMNYWRMRSYWDEKKIEELADKFNRLHKGSEADWSQINSELDASILSVEELAGKFKNIHERNDAFSHLLTLALRGINRLRKSQLKNERARAAAAATK